MNPTTRHRLPCSICNVPTDGLWMDRALCDGCLDEMAEELGTDRVSPEVAHAAIEIAREKLAEAYSDRREEGWRQW